LAAELPQDFVPRPREFCQLRHLLLGSKDQEPIAITTALRGAGGLGKTTLAAALCHDQGVREAFRDGILWATLGQTPEILRELTKLYATLTGNRPAFVDVDDAAGQFAGVLEHRTCLIVVDDVWEPAHLRPFLRGGSYCARLLTPAE
jgi:hypothetical protein